MRSMSKQVFLRLNKVIESRPSKLQIRTYARRNLFPSKVAHYLYRAKLVNSLRLALRSNPDPDTNASLLRVLSDRFLDGFVVSAAIRSAPSADAALSLLGSLERLTRFSHSQNTVHSLATVLAKSRRNGELEALISDVNGGKFGNVRISFMNLMHWHAATGDLGSALQVWNEYRDSSNRRVCTESYNLVMDLYAKNGKDSDAVSTFYRMIDEGAIPNNRTYTIMIEHLVSSDTLSPAMEIFRLLPSMRMKRTSRLYQALVEAFVAAKQFDQVNALLKEMQIDGVLPGRAMRLSLEKMSEAGFEEETAEFLREMVPDERIKGVELCSDYDSESDGDGDVIRLKPFLDPRALCNAFSEWTPAEVSALEDAGFVWTSRLFCKVVRNFKSPETAWKFFCWVAFQPGFTHDIFTVQRTMSLLARHGKAELVEKLFSKVRSERMTLPFATVRLVIEFFGLSKNAEAALNIFRRGRDLCGPISEFNTMILYSSLLRTLTKCERDSEAMEVLDEMVSEGARPDVQTFTGMMNHFASRGDISTVQRLFGSMRRSGVEPDGFVFKVLIEAYCKCERATIALRVFGELRGKGVIPDPATKELLVNSLWKEGKRREAALVEESCLNTTTVLPLRLCGHVWSVSSSDLIKVFTIYSNSFKSNSR